MKTCTHTSDWHKEMRPCSVCGASHSDEEAKDIGYVATRTFSKEQRATINRMAEESERES